MNFEQFFLILRARAWVVLFTIGASVGVATGVSYFMPKEYTASGDLIIDTRSADPVAGNTLPPSLLPGYVATQVDVIRSKRVTDQVVAALLASNPSITKEFTAATGGGGNIKDWLGSALIKNLVVTPSHESNVISLSFTGRDPQYAASVVNLFSESYIQANIEIMVEPAKQISNWFNQQIKQLRAELESAQQKLSKFERENGIVAGKDRFDLENARLAELSRQLVTAETDRSQQQSRLRTGGTADGVEELPEVQNSPLIQRLKIDVVALESKLADLSTKVGQNHPQYQRAVDELKTLRTRLDAERADVLNSLRTGTAAAQRQEASLRGATDQQRTRIIGLTRKRDEAAVLVREVDNAQRAYDFALQKASQSSLQSQVSQANIAILNSAVAPITPSRPRVVLNIVSAVFLGTLVGVGIALMVEIRDRRVRSLHDLKNEYDTPVYGSLPKTRYGTFASASSAD